ncbi:MAG: M1 family peptidase [Bacteroidetes bacterium]|nr:MAG: M1 family peptidase [Bacteroidota bacterium]
MNPSHFLLRFYLLFVIGSGLLACDKAPVQESIVDDPHSYARPEEARVQHLSLDLSVDFDKGVLAGTATLELARAQGAKQVILDTRGLDIQQVWISNDGQAMIPATHRLGPTDSIMGATLAVELSPNTRFVRIAYATEPGAEALQFLPPALTSGSQPFLLTQSQAILARTWIPIQDSPGIRFTYDAKVRVPKGLMALMSAENPVARREDGVYTFKMSQPVPAYLLALAVGDIEFAPLGPRSGVYAEPSVLEAAKYELAEVEEMIDIAEALYGPYRWERYDVIILPPSFPFGGMENPRLTFATPTILAGDRSLVSLIAHELAHSWSGNLVTNATWNDFWLNEGFTVYFEYRIMEGLKGRGYSEMLAHLSYQDLLEEVADIGPDHADTHLALQLEGRNPDDGMTSIAYDKGYYFLRRIEETVGREAFDAFLRSYFDRYAFKTMTTTGFLQILDQELLQKHPEAAETVQIDAWVYGPGIPDQAPVAQSTRFDLVEDAVAAWIVGVSPTDLKTEEWSSHEWIHFIRSLPDSIGTEKMAALDAAFAFTRSTNSEVQARWYARAIREQYTEAYPAIRRFLTRVGRRKFLTPLYRALIETGQRDLALDIYREARSHYHPISVQSIDELLDWPV